MAHARRIKPTVTTKIMQSNACVHVSLSDILILLQRLHVHRKESLNLQIGIVISPLKPH